MKSTVKCYRCGKEYDLSYKTVKEVISCDHCHQKMKLDKRTSRNFKIVRYLLVLAVCLAIAFGMNRISDNNFIILGVTLVFALLLASVADQLCSVLVDVLFGITYEEYHPEVISKKEKRKNNTNKKKGLFR